LFEGMVIDGWHRFQALEHLGIEPRFVDLPDDADPVAFVLSRNLHRRHLDAGQRAVAVTKCHDWKPEGKAKKILEPGALVSVKTTAELAKIAQVSPQTIKDAKTVIKAGRADEVMDGKASVQAIARPERHSKAPKLAPAPIEEEPEGASDGDLIQDLERVMGENKHLEALVSSLTKSDQGKEIVNWKGKFDAVNGRINQMLTTEREMRKQLEYYVKLCASIRKVLGVEKSAEILPALKERLGV
jgi:hypothetical protein